MIPTSSDQRTPMISSTRLRQNVSRRAIILRGLRGGKVSMQREVVDAEPFEFTLGGFKCGTQSCLLSSMNPKRRNVQFHTWLGSLGDEEDSRFALLILCQKFRRI